MADLLWSIATSYAVLSIIGTLLVASLVIGHVPFGRYAPVIGPYVALARFAAYLFLAMLGVGIGHRLCSERAALRQAKIDLAFSELQLNAQKQATETAERLRSEAEAKASEANQKVTDYEAELAKQPQSDTCALTDGDVRRLREIAH